VINAYFPELTGRPGLVQPDLKKKQDFDGLRTCIEAQKMMLSYSQYIWWQSFLENPLQVLSDLSEPSTWQLDNLQRYITVQPIGVVSLQSPLAIMQLKEFERPTVFSSTPINGTIGQCKEGLAVGFMIAYKALGNQRIANVGEIVAIRQNRVKILKYLQKTDSKWESDNEMNKFLLIQFERILCVFRLTKSKRLPAFAVKKMKEYTQK
jgi:hypothetical protein